MKFERIKKNPIIQISDIKPSAAGMEVIGVFNCGVAEYAGKIVLLLRVAERAISDERFARVPMFDAEKGEMVIRSFPKSDKDIDFSDVRFVKTKEQLFLTSISHLRLAFSSDGVDFTIEDKPFMAAENEYEEFGVEDPRITELEGWYYINYSAISRAGVVTSLARTKDFLSVERMGIIFLADNKDVVIFPQKVGGRYCALHRPVSAYFQRPEMWISYSDNLTAYDGHKRLCRLREGHFDSARLGASCVPFLTEKGWIEIYHGCDENDAYCLGALLLDKDSPEKIIARSELPLVFAEEEYEKKGFMPNVIFSCGLYRSGDVLNIYYGACDECVCLGRITLQDVFESLGV